MNNDLISRSELKKAIDTYDRFACLITNHLVPVRQLLCPEQYESYVPYRDVIKCIDNAPTVEARPTGEWIESKEHFYTNESCKEWTNFYCSECDEPSSSPSDFCPNCGAKMKVGEEE